MKRINAINSALSLILILLLLLSTACALPLGKDNSAAAGALAESDNTSLIYTDWSAPPVENQAPVLPSIADVVASVKPSVVAIDTEMTVTPFSIDLSISKELAQDGSSMKAGLS